MFRIFLTALKKKAGFAKRKAESLLARFNPSRPALPKLPVILDLETTTVCNIEPPCVMCCRARGPVSEVPFIPEPIIDRLSVIFPRLEYASLHGIGEPLTQEKLFSLMERFSPDTDLAFNSNGILLDKTKINRLIERRLHLICVSIDAATPETYRKIRRRANFNLIKDNLRLLTRTKKERGVDYPKLVISMTLMKENLLEVVDFVRMAKEIGAEVIETHLLHKAPTNYSVDDGPFQFDYEAQMIDPKSPEFMEKLQAAKKAADEAGILFVSTHHVVLAAIGRSHRLLNHRKKYFCLRPWKNVLSTLDGNVRMCCHMCGEESILGNLNKNDFHTIWNGARARSIRKAIAAGIMPAVCRNCPELEP